jgi:proline dehydrogenase
MIAGTIGWIPKPIVRKVASRYVAGERLEDGIAVAKRLNAEGCMTTFDVLGEFVRDEAQADETAGAYLELLDRIHGEGIDGNVSIKLTAFGLLLDEEATRRRVERVVAHARALGNFVRIDMEDSPQTDRTLQLYRGLRASGYDNVGVVLQAYMRRTLRDVADLRALRPNYRLCKGIYVEPPEIAFKDPDEIRRNYVAALRAMIEGGSYIGIATHDEQLVNAGMALVAEFGLDRQAYEFQMLLGVTEALRRRIVAAGHRLRVYVPFGRDWYGYCTRRLKENPAIGRHVFLALFGRKS